MRGGVVYRGCGRVWKSGLVGLRWFLDAALLVSYILLFFFFNDTATTEIYTLSLHDALPICIYLSFK